MQIFGNKNFIPSGLFFAFTVFIPKFYKVLVPPIAWNMQHVICNFSPNRKENIMRYLKFLIILSLLLAGCSSSAGEGESSSPNLAPIEGNQAKNTHAYVSFIINVDDWVHSNESAETLIRLIDLFEKYGVRGDFYLTAPVVKTYQQTNPDLIARLRDSEMTISYHIRAPHPLYEGFDARLQGLSDEELYKTLLDYETYALDMQSGDLNRAEPGGYSYVAQVFGRKPVVAPAPAGSPQIKRVAQRVYADLGAQMTLLYHEGGTDPENPFEYANGLLVRPSDFGVTRITPINGSQNFWWNMMTKPNAEEFAPLLMLKTQLDEWEAQNYARAPFITVLIHENNFYRAGSAAWGSYYYEIEHGNKSTPLSPPFDLNAPDPSTPRSDANKAAIWEAYEALVAYSAENLDVVTSEDILAMAKEMP